MHDASIQAYVFLFFFSFGYLVAGKRPILKLSTRAVLVVLFGLALLFALDHSRWHDIIAGATLTANAAFVAFAAIDYAAWMKKSRVG